MLSRPTSHTRRALWMDRKWMCGMCVRHSKVGHKSIFFLMFLSILLQFHLRHWLFFCSKSLRQGTYSAWEEARVHHTWKVGIVEAEEREGHHHPFLYLSIDQQALFCTHTRSKWRLVEAYCRAREVAAELCEILCWGTAGSHWGHAS